jgi:hypothetical protein
MELTLSVTTIATLNLKIIKLTHGLVFIIIDFDPKVWNAVGCL